MAILLPINSQFLILIIRIYQFVSYLIGKRACCRFSPTCSQYGIEALREFGVVNGSFLILKRILKCHPLNPGGYDPIPKNI